MSGEAAGSSCEEWSLSGDEWSLSCDETNLSGDESFPSHDTAFPSRDELLPSRDGAFPSREPSPAGEEVRLAHPYGEIEGINLYGCKTGDSPAINLGRFNATPANASVPLANGNPEDWMFFARAVKRDQEIGQPSPTISVIVRS